MKNLYEVLGYKKVEFEKNGNFISGFRIYLSIPFADGKGVGLSAENIFLSSKKLNEMGYSPNLGDKLDLYYNRYGKVELVKLVPDGDMIIE